MLEILQGKVEAIAEHYADLIAMRLESALSEPAVDSPTMTEINDGIRMLNHIAATLERIKRLHCGND